jgi:hypothetical protein
MRHRLVLSRIDQGIDRLARGGPVQVDRFFS